MKLKGTVKNGAIAVDLPDGTSVTVTVEDRSDRIPGIGIVELDNNGDLIMTPELEAELRQAEAEADRGLGIPAEDVIRELRQRR